MIRTRSPEAEQVAAIEIQRFWRGYNVRSKLQLLFQALLTEIEYGIVDSFPETPSHQSPEETRSAQSSRSLDNHVRNSLTQGQADVGHVKPKKSTRKRKSSVGASIKRQRTVSDSNEGSPKLTRSLSKPTRSLSRPTHSLSKEAQSFSSETVVKKERATKSAQSDLGGRRLSKETVSTTSQSHIKGTWLKRAAKSNSSIEHSGTVRFWLADQKRKQTHKKKGAGAKREGAPLDERGVPAKHLKMTKKSASRLALEASYDRYVQHALKRGQTSTDMLQFTEYCAHKIQIWWLLKHRRFLRERFIQRLQELQKKAALESAAMMEAMIQEASRNVPKKKKREGPLTEREAAISIQRAWRRHIDIQVYRYYRDLINFKTRGNPAVMLRCINPTEAKLLDPASGTAVKFRLAGDRFPPNIYYKIFTHRPIQDLCANSPKDYTIPQAKQLNVRHRHNKVAKIPVQQDDKAQWYQRFENNGWRLVSDRLIHHIMNDPITWESSKKTYHFDHSKLKRKQDVEKHKKTRKIEWMKKMYQQGMLRARADDPETVQLIEGAAAGMMATVDNQGPDALEDWEVDELLDWTTSLNFEEYFSTWKDLATSAGADYQLEKSMSIGTSKSDPYELTVSTAPSRFQSTRQSHHTTGTLNSGSIHIRT